MENTSQAELNILFETAKQKNYACVLYRLPFSTEINLLFGESNTVKLAGLFTPEDSESFLFAPFHFPEMDCTKVKKLFSGNLNSTAQLLKKTAELPIRNKTKNASPDSESFTKKTDYINQIEHCIDRIKSGFCQKVVLSRCEKRSLTENFSPAAFYLDFEKAYPNTFAYLFYSPETGFWAGATPELLGSLEKNTFQTVSLAGTLPADKAHQWSEKELQEQQIVTEYIIDQLKEKTALPLEVSETENVLYGNLKHLKTTITIQQFEEKWLPSILESLHPTPAVCGMPKQNALKVIPETENHDRKFYTGFIGIYSSENSAKFFVNLRCAELTDNEITLYAGGGITIDSVAENEWEETQWKMESLGRFL